MTIRLFPTKHVLLLTLKLLFVLLLAVSAYYLLKEMPVRHQGCIYRDKVQHASLFFVLTLMALLLFRRSRLTLLFLLICYGGVTEYIQSTMTKTRTGSITDWLADLAGICMACLLIWIGAHVATRRQKK